jgi:hypothetical protein
MKLPILIGSKAALIAGYLPYWRNGSTNDTDIICSLEYRDNLLAEQQPSTHIVSTSWRGVMFDHPKGIHLNYEIMPDEIVDRIAALCSKQTTLFPNHDALLAPMEVVWAARVYTVGYSERSLEKAARDAAFYDALPKNLTDEHLAIADIIRQRGLINLMELLNKPD